MQEQPWNDRARGQARKMRLSTHDFHDEHNHFPFLAGHGREEMAKLGCSVKPRGGKTEMQTMQIVVARLLVDSPAWCVCPLGTLLITLARCLCRGAPRSPGGLVLRGLLCVSPLPCPP